VTDAHHDRRRWVALWVLCIGVLMIVLDTTIVTVALPTIKSDLHFTGSSLIWVLNGYMLTFGGFLLLGGRLGDLYGRRRLFLIGMALFTLSSLACGLAQARLQLIAFRALQGVGGAVVTAVSLSLIMTLFTEPTERARAMGVYSFIASAGGSIGELLGGLLTQVFGWHSIFLLNLPIGIGVYFATASLLPHEVAASGRRRLDIAGAVTVTVGLMLAVYAIVNANRLGWLSPATLRLLGLSLVLLVLFLWIEARGNEPLMPLRMLLMRNIVVSNTVSALWSAGMFAWFVLSALYLQYVLGYDPFRVGLSFLPADLIIMAFSIGLSAQMVLKWGMRTPLWVGLILTAAALASFARAPVHGHFLPDVLPGMVLIGIGVGMGFNPLLLLAMSGVDESDTGLASGLVNTSFMMGGAFGLALLASLADADTQRLTAMGSDGLSALTHGYHAAFAVSALLTLVASALAGVWLRAKVAGAVPELS
jgi:EmrB/QacA subfamily drug resistance transporter